MHRQKGTPKNQVHLCTVINRKCQRMSLRRHLVEKKIANCLYTLQGTNVACQFSDRSIYVFGM